MQTLNKTIWQKYSIAYSNYELGQRDIPTDILIALAEYHKTNVDYLLGLTKNKTYYKDM